MSVVVIGTGGGHAALERLQLVSARMAPTERAVAQRFVDIFTRTIHEMCDDIDGPEKKPHPP